MKLCYINKTRLIITVLIFSIIFSSLAAAMDNAKSNIEKSVLRLHIIANSDSAFDQSLKLKVRDRVLKEAGDIFKTAASPTDALEKARGEEDLLIACAKEVIESAGMNYNIRVETGSFGFPARNYGDIMLPAGSYDAVRIIIGEGKGKNWWCVMFPPMCLAKGTVKLSEDSDAYLKANLSESEYELIKSSSEPTVEIRFKLLEILEDLF